MRNKLSVFFALISISAYCQESAFSKQPSAIIYNPNLTEIDGQSNAVGSADNSTLQSDLAGAMAGSHIFNRTSNTWEVMTPAVNSRGTDGLNGTGQADNNFGGFGIESRLMKLLIAARGVDQYMFKFCVGNTPMFPTGATRDWNTASIGELFTQGNTSFNLARLKIADSRPPRVYIWIQGENDANVTNASSYESYLTGYIRGKRAAYQWLQMPIIIVRMGDLQTTYNATYRNIIRQAQQNVDAADANVYLVDADALATYDGTHYNAASIDTLAQRVYALMLANGFVN